jgi:Cu-Zn family superoxide dismutase
MKRAYEGSYCKPIVCAGHSWTTCAVRGFIVSGLFAFLLAACQNGPTFFDDPSAIAVLSGTPGSTVHGVVTFVRKGDATLVNANMAGLKPNGTRGMHIHEFGDCSARDASSAGQHFNPGASEHGSPDSASHHAGDLGNITADAKGEVYVSFEIADGTFGTGNDSIVGRSIVVHAERDDLHTQPAGNSGDRIACGVILRNPDRMTYAQAAH